MSKKWKKIAAAAVTCVLASSMALGASACGPKKRVIPDANLKKGTMRSFTKVMPSNWNEFTYSDSNDTQILGYIGSAFFEYDFEFDEAKGGKFRADGTINAEAIVPNKYTVKYSAATALKDVTATVDAKWGYTAAEKAEGGYAWEITLRDDLQWEDGTPINADSFVYSMKEMLNPDFLNSRADTYYQTLIVKNARTYFYKNQEYLYSTVGSKGYEKNKAALDAGETIYIDVFGFYNAQGYQSEDGKYIDQWVAYNDDTVYDKPDVWAAYKEHNTDEKKEAFLKSKNLVYVENLVDKEGEKYNTWATGTDPKAEGYEEYGELEDAFAAMIGSDAFSGSMLWNGYFKSGAPYAGYVEVGASYENWLGLREVNTGDRTIPFENVGFYKTSNHSVVICMGKSYQFLKQDGSLSYLAPYYMSSLPLVKQDLYESCKQQPKPGAKLWTSDYCSSLEKTASWGAYKLTAFQTDMGYTFERNENWYGYKLEDNKNQYNITKMEVKKIAKDETAWESFFKGELDGKSLDTAHIKDYQYSKYVKYSTGTGTFGMQIYSNLPVLKNSGRNNTILAIDKFRKAFSLSLNRSEVVEQLWPGTTVANYGAMNNLYYYDVENGKMYRESVQAKKALLRVYGFTEGADGKWSNGDTIVNKPLDDAYEAVTGYNPVLAKQLFREACAELVADQEKYGYDASKPITLVWGSSAAITPNIQRRVDYVQNILDDLSKDTPLEGKFKIEFKEVGKEWAARFRAGAYEIAFGTGFSGNPLNPYVVIGNFVDDSSPLNYHTYWKPSSEMKTFKLPAGDYDQAGKEVTMSIKNWFDCLNGFATLNNDEFKYNWDAGKAPESVRLEILAMLEEVALSKYYSVMLIAEYNGSLSSPKFSDIVDEENFFMGYGGSRYAIVNYTDEEWDEFVKSQPDGNLESLYKKTAE